VLGAKLQYYRAKYPNEGTNVGIALVLCPDPSKTRLSPRGDCRHSETVGFWRLHRRSSSILWGGRPGGVLPGRMLSSHFPSVHGTMQYSSPYCSSISAVKLSNLFQQLDWSFSAYCPPHASAEGPCLPCYFDLGYFYHCTYHDPSHLHTDVGPLWFPMGAAGSRGPILRHSLDSRCEYGIT
jgi:hypothetical protein